MDEDELTADPEAVAASLERIRAGVRQRQALLATMPEDGSKLPPSLAQVQSTQYLEQPVPTSHRRVLGPMIVFGKKAFYHLFLKWYLRPLLLQQNAFNRTVSIALQDLFERQRGLARVLDREVTQGTPGEDRDLTESDLGPGGK